MNGGLLIIDTYYRLKTFKLYEIYIHLIKSKIHYELN